MHEVRQELRLEGLQGLDLDSAIDLRREICRAAVAGQSLASTGSLVAPYLDKPWYRAGFGEGPISARGALPG